MCGGEVGADAALATTSSDSFSACGGEGDGSKNGGGVRGIAGRGAVLSQEEARHMDTIEGRMALRRLKLCFEPSANLHRLPIAFLSLLLSFPPLLPNHPPAPNANPTPTLSPPLA